MSRDPEQQLGELLDRALGEELGLYFQPAWHPKYKARKRTRTWRIALGSLAAAAAVFAALPFTVQPPVGHGTVATTNRNLAAIHLPRQMMRELGSVSSEHVSVASMTPVYGTYPVASPTGHDLTVTGRFTINASAGDTLSLQVNNQMQIQGGVLFNQGTPVYTFTGSSLTSGAGIPPASAATPIAGEWFQRENLSITTVSSPGNHVYITHGNLWADLVSNGGTKYWMTSPGSPSRDTVDSISGLPSSPDQALLLEENPSGLSQGYITPNGGATWHPWGMGKQAVSNLIAIGDRYWAILNGTLAWSADGQHWHSVLQLNVSRWQVETYAVDPANPNVMTVALIPISGDGVGPVLETKNGGQTWNEVPNFPAVGAAPTTMVMTQTGDIAALINANGPVIVRYSAKRGHWSIFPVPAAHNNLGLGQLAASPNGNLLYGAPGGLVYQWVRQSNAWLVVKPPTGADTSGQSPSLLGAIGNQQVAAGYPGGWWIFYEPPSDFRAAMKSVKASHAPIANAAAGIKLKNGTTTAAPGKP